MAEIISQEEGGKEKVNESETDATKDNMNRATYDRSSIDFISDSSDDDSSKAIKKALLIKDPINDIKSEENLLDTPHDDIATENVLVCSTFSKRSRTDEVEENSLSKILRAEESMDDIEEQDNSNNAPLVFFTTPQNFVQDVYLSSYSFLLPTNLPKGIIPQFRIEWPAKSAHKQSGQADSYGEILYKSIIGFKTLDVSMDVLKVVQEPTPEYLKELRACCK
jgi:hypothetical protein